MKKRKVYRKILIGALFVCILAIFAMGYAEFNDSIPDNLKIVVNRQESFDFSLPMEAYIGGNNISVLNISNGKVDNKSIHFNMSKPFTIQSSQKGQYKIDLKLFGLFTLKKINLDVIENIELIPCGVPIGIYVETDGVMVLGTGVVASAEGFNYEPALNILKSGDYITQVNHVEVYTIEDMIKEIQQCKGRDIQIELRRNGSKLKVKVAPIKGTDGQYKIGAWIRDNTQGIGTLTYVTKEHLFGALGHGITDVDTGLLMETIQGGIYKAQILKIIKGQAGKPGELVGLINLNEEYKIGDILVNSNQGIFGENGSVYGDIVYKEPIPVGLKQDIKIGKASILCQLENKVEEYEIQIEKIELNTNSHSKGLEIRITDKKLLELTNGIVQGMSGSPIIQNNKLIGAVTHVFIQDSTKGYGTFIENMLQY